MITAAQHTAQISLATLESNFIKFSPEEQSEIEVFRMWLREGIVQHGSSMKLAIIAVGFEIAISEKQ